MEPYKITNILLISLSLVLLSCQSSTPLPLETNSPELIIHRGNFFDTEKEYAVILREDNQGSTFIKTIENPLYALDVLVQNSSIDTIFSVKGLPIDAIAFNCEIADYNFDGKNDIAVNLYTSARGNSRRCIFLYNSNKESFDYVVNSHLLHSLSVDDSLKLIKSDFEKFSDEIAGYYHRDDYYQYNGLTLEKVPLNLAYQNQISILPSESVRQFVATGDTFPITATNSYALLEQEKKIQAILADTQGYKRKLLIGAYPNQKKRRFDIEIREFIDVRAAIIASFSVDAYNGAIFFEPKPFSEAYEKGLKRIEIYDWDSKLE